MSEQDDTEYPVRIVDVYRYGDRAVLETPDGSFIHTELQHADEVDRLLNLRERKVVAICSASGDVWRIVATTDKR